MVAKKTTTKETSAFTKNGKTHGRKVFVRSYFTQFPVRRYVLKKTEVMWMDIICVQLIRKYQNIDRNDKKQMHFDFLNCIALLILGIT